MRAEELHQAPSQAAYTHSIIKQRERVEEKRIVTMWEDKLINNYLSF